MVFLVFALAFALGVGRLTLRWHPRIVSVLQASPLCVCFALASANC
ncbi:putative nucleolar protein (plasmid) [Paraburkholderia caribensis MBA4]|uniref:Putative nucleolar protein n=1 Tax=Paraburkholderia caribensis MBA4 TaxID=1323664 RepID=A0A0P0RLE7_9BURK|nr:putative nucleolar protein [Paraburkholderia caribensis MBA4]